MVSITCITYNHEKYIRKALDSFLSQKTQYRFEILIHDDASTDATADIIREYVEKYPDIVHAVLQTENQYSKKVPITQTFLLPLAKGKYVALCEGDDFWMDDEKLEKQISFLESHEDAVACVHSGKYINEDGEERGDLFRAYDGDRYVSMEDAITEWLVPTASFVCLTQYRRDTIPFKQDAPCGDLPLMIYLLSKGKVWYIDEPMCGYRVNSVSSLSRVQQKNNFEKNKKWTERMVGLFSRIDEYTNFEYTDRIAAKIKRYWFGLYLRYCKWSKLLSREFIDDYKALPFKTKVSNVIGFFSPKLQTKLQQKIKKGQSSKGTAPIIKEK